MAMSLEVSDRGEAAEHDPKMIAARAKVFAACKANHISFLNELRSTDVISMLQEGVMVGPASAETAAIGRKFTHRSQPY